MDKKKQHIPVYSLGAFSSAKNENQPFQVEEFDANRHFQVEYPHRHDFYEILFLTKGSGFHIIDSHEYFIKPPCIFFLSPGQAHKLDLSNDIEGFLFIFTADYYLLNKRNHNRLLEFPFFFTVEQNNPPLLLKDKKDIHFFEMLFLRGITELKNKKDTYYQQLRSILDLILVTSASLYPKEHALVARGKGHILVKRFLQLVEETYQENNGVQFYADQLSITTNHLTQLVKQLTGKTSNQIIASKQILEIKRLLVHTRLDVSEIADHLHFSDQSYFTRFFKRETGATPLQFRLNGK